MLNTSKTVPILDFSDGDPTHRPGNQYRVVQPPTLYLEKLAHGWMTQRGEVKPGIRYRLDKLPRGYELYERSRPSAPNVYDRHLFGHPEHKYFDSPNRFLPHFLHLMANRGSNFGCPCTVCIRSTGRRSSTASASASASDRVAIPIRGPSSRGRPTGRYRGRGRGRGRGDLVQTRLAPAPVTQVDDEGNPDVYRNLIDRLKKSGTLDVPITETMSMDWRAEKDLLQEQYQAISKQPMWMPRVGEIVLFVRSLAENEVIEYHSEIREHRIIDTETGQDRGIPDWEAGVVAQVPVEDADLATHFQVNYSGFRVEPLPDPNKSDKKFSKRYKYISSLQLRPFMNWKTLLDRIPEATWDPTIRHALTVMSTVSLVDKYNFSGVWPAAEISCRGLFLGSELLIVGDVVRLMPADDSDNHVTDILKITAIKLKLLRLDQASSDERDDGHPYNSAIHVTGKAYTTDKSRAIEPIPSLPPDLRKYASYSQKWYGRHANTKSYQAPFSRILGRCYEPETAKKWCTDVHGLGPVPNLSEGLEAARQARKFSSSNLKRIAEDKIWYWGDSRTDSLDLHTLNGEEVAQYDETRDPKRWRRQIKVIMGEADERERQTLKEQSIRSFRAFKTANSLVSAALQPEEDSAAVSFDETTASSRGTSQSGSRLAPYAIEGDDDDESGSDESDLDRTVTGMAGDVHLALPLDDEFLDDSDGYESPAKRMRRLEPWV